MRLLVCLFDKIRINQLSVFLLFLLVINSFNSFGQSLSHRSGYFTMFPYNSSYDDGSHARLFYDGKKKIINFWNSTSGINTSIFAAGSRFNKTSISEAKGSANNSFLRDAWLTGNYGPPEWVENRARWKRLSGKYNDIGGIIWQDEGTYFIRDQYGFQVGIYK